MTLTVVGPTHPFRGGISHYTSLLVRSLREQHEVRFLSYSRQYPGWLYPGDSDRDPSTALLTQEQVSLRFDALNPWAWWRIGRDVARSGSSLVILQWSTVYWSPFYWIFLKALRREGKTQSVFICHNVVEHEANWLKSWGSQLVLGIGDYFITHSHWDKSNLTPWVGRSRTNTIRVCPHPRYEHLKQQTIGKAEARASLGIRAERVLLFFGFIRPYKGLHYLLESLPQVKARLDIHLLIAGEVWGDVKTYMDTAERLKITSSITFVPGYIPNEDVGRYFEAADILVAPYVTATQSGIVQLAYGFGKPVIVSNVGGLPEAVTAGETGYLVPPCDASAIAHAILDYYENRREAAMVQAVAQRRSLASWDRLSQTIEEIAEDSLRS